MIWIIIIIIVIIVIVNKNKKKAPKDPYQGAVTPPQKPAKSGSTGSGATTSATGGSKDALSADAFADAFAHMRGGESGGSGKQPEPAPVKKPAPEKKPEPPVTPKAPEEPAAPDAPFSADDFARALAHMHGEEPEPEPTPEPEPAPAPEPAPDVVPRTPADEAAQRDEVRSNPVTTNIMMDWYQGWSAEESTYQEMISAGVAYFTLTVQSDRIVQEMFLKKGGSATTEFPFSAYDPNYNLDTPVKQDELYQLIGTILDSQSTITWENKERFVLKQISDGGDTAAESAPAEPEPEAPADSSLEAQLQAMLQQQGRE